jgi:hypothetical protein
MGCTASKKRTTSIDDLTSDSKKPTATVNNEKPIVAQKAGTTSTAVAAAPTPNDSIQIPGAHKSFLAPDGIPFIDEDVDDEQAPPSSTVAKPSDDIVLGRPDVNKNTVAPPPPPSTTTQQQQQQQQEEEEKKRAVALDILTQELNTTTQKAARPPSSSSSPPPQDTDVQTTTTTTFTEYRTTTTTVTHNNAEPHEPTLEEKEKAAIKIQAGMRGFHDRLKVRALREGHENGNDDDVHNDQENAAATKIQNQSGGTEVNGLFSLGATEQQVADHSDDDIDPEKQKAAVKIQASYKGWKTRKSMGKIK